MLNYKYTDDIRHKADVLRDAGFEVILSDINKRIHSDDVVDTFYRYEFESASLFIGSNSKWDKTLSNRTLHDGTFNENFTPRYMSIIIEPLSNMDMFTEFIVVHTIKDGVDYVMLCSHVMNNFLPNDVRAGSTIAKGLDCMPFIGKGVKVVTENFSNRNTVTRHVISKLKGKRK